jgi:hypothetical protein
VRGKATSLRRQGLVAALLDRERGYVGGRQQQVAASSQAATSCLLASRKLAGQESWLAQVSTVVGTSTSAGLVRITTSDTTSASTAKTAASWKEVEIPWASTWWAYWAGS